MSLINTFFKALFQDDMSISDNSIDCSYLDKDLLDENKHLRVKDSEFYKKIPFEHLKLWCHYNGVYGLPTTELIDWLKPHIIIDKTIEVGAGNGILGRSLNIPITDLCTMNDPKVRIFYQMFGQPTTQYPKDIVVLEASEAVKHYKPEVVIACWVTQIYKEEEGSVQKASMFGLDEEFIIKNVKKYIVIGDERIHGTKRILKYPHQTLKFSWLYSRASFQKDNLIYIWENIT